MNRFALIPLFAALSAAGAFIKIPFFPVPLTLQTFFVIMAGIVLGPRAGCMSQVIYLLVGLLGFPVFAGGGGLSYLLKPSFGYLLGFCVAPLISGLLARRRTPLQVLTASLAATAVIYAVGVPWLWASLHFVLDKPGAFGLAVKTGLAIFLPGDLLKCILLMIIVPRLKFDQE